MNCICGNDLGPITIETRGLCKRCKRSLWIQAAQVRQIDPRHIAEDLNKAGRSLCEHAQTLCLARCGVMLIDQIWVVVPQDQRDDWFRKALEPA